MKEKIYHCLSLLNIILFTIVSSIFLHYEIKLDIFLNIYLVSIIWIIVLCFAVKNIQKQKSGLPNIYFNIIIFLLTPICFFYQQWLSSLILLICILLPIFLPYEKLTNRQLSWNFLILFSMLLIVFIITTNAHREIDYSWNYWILILSIILFISFLIKKKYWIILFHLFLLSFFIYHGYEYIFIEPFIADFTTFNFILIAYVMLYIGLSAPFVFMTFSLVYFNIESRKNLLKQKTDTE